MKKQTAASRSAGARPGGGLTLRLLIKLQALYCLLGIGYNVVSLVLAKTGGSPLSSTSPVTGFIVMAAYGGCVAVGALHYVRIYRVLMALSVLVLGYGGIVIHVMNFMAGRTFLYDSTAAWAVAVGINVYGIVLNFIAALGLFSDETR